MSKVVAIANQKGGVGKTTTAVNLAAALGLKGKRILLVDMDPQGNTTTGFGISKLQAAASSYELLIGASTVEDVTVHTAFQGVDVIPSSMNLSGAEVELVPIPHWEMRLKVGVSPVLDRYDFVLIDCPPSLGLVTVNALCAADSILIPIQCEYYALEGLTQLMNSVRHVKQSFNPALEVEGVLLTMYDGRLNLTQQVVNEVKKYFPRKVYATCIPRAVRLSEAPSYGQPVQYYDASSRGAEAYNALAAEFLKNNK